MNLILSICLLMQTANNCAANIVSLLLIYNFVRHNKKKVLKLPSLLFLFHFQVRGIVYENIEFSGKITKGSLKSIALF